MRILMRKIAPGIAMLIIISLSYINAKAETHSNQWVIPYLNNLTGVYAGFGQFMTFAIQDTVDRINEKGGISGRVVKVTLHDTGSNDATMAVAAMSKVVCKNLMIWGPQDDVSVSAVLPLLQKSKAFSLMYLTRPDKLERYGGNTISLLSPLHACVRGTTLGWLKQNSAIKSVAIFLNSMDPMWKVHAEVQREALKKVGVEVYPIVEISSGVDMGAAVIKALSYEPDAFAMQTAPEEGAKILKELNKLGFTERKHILFSPIHDTPQFYEIAGEMKNNCYISNMFDVQSKNPKWVEFSNRFSKKFGFPAPPIIGPAIDAVTITKRCLEETKVTGAEDVLDKERSRIMDWMKDVKNVRGVMSDFNIVNYQAMLPGYLYQWRDGKLKEIGEYLKEGGIR